MGHDYKGDTGHYHTILENIPAAAAKFEYRDGYFGKSSPDGKTKNRNIASDDPVKTAKEFYNAIANGGIEEPMANGKGVVTVLADGTAISYRKVSSSPDRSSVVEINISDSTDTGGVKTQKIHFIQS